MATTKLQARSLIPSLTANDIKKSFKFYTEGLGLSVKDEMKDDKGELNGVMLEAGGAVLGISQDDFAKGRDRVKGVGVRLWIETEQDIEMIARSVKAAGFTLDNEPAPLPWGPLGFAVTDPDGYKLTISKPNQ